MSKLREAAQAVTTQAENTVIASIPNDLRENMRKAQEAFEKSGGCKGCGSQIIAVHYGDCSVASDLY